MTLHSSRPDARTDLLHGTLDMLILRTLQWGPQHGYAIGQTIRAQSSDVLQVEAGSLYPALQRLAKTRLGHLEVGPDRGQPARQVLSAHPRRQEAAPARGVALDRAGERDRPGDETGDAGIRGVACRCSSLAEAAAPGSRETTFRTRSARTWRSPPTSGWPTAPTPRRRTTASLKDFGNVTLTTEAARRVWTPWWLDALRDLGERRPLRDPRAREEPRLLAHRGRRAHARHRPERRGLHDAQEPRAQPARRRRRLGRARAWSSRDERADGRCASRIPTTSTCAITTARSRDCSARP